MQKLIDFIEQTVPKGRKTRSFEVFKNLGKGKMFIGTVEWKTNKRAYTFEVYQDDYFLPLELLEIAHFILQLEAEHKKTKRKAKGEYAP